MNVIEGQARSIFLDAVGRAPDDWPAFLDAACGGDGALRARVDQLLRAHRAMGSIHGTVSAAPAATADGPPGEAAGAAVGPYKLLEQIGEGGFGVVWMAEQTRPVRRKVALKVLKPGMDTRQVVARFEAERQALALMDHPNIARVFDGGAAPSGRPYFVMELVKGVPITQFCDQDHLAPRQRLELFIPVCHAVQHAHQKGIIHRDLKPSNVLVTVHDTIPVVKVIDFGVAKALGQELTDQTLFTGFAQMIGTPLYMSPEQAGQSGLDVDTRSDVYSLGVLLYELLTGTTPFDQERLRNAGYDEMRRIIREEEPARPSTRLSTLGPGAAATVSANRHSDPRKLGQLLRGELDWIVMKALEKDRNRRYESASAFAADVQRYLADEPVLACPPSAAYRLRKFARRNKRSLATLGVIALAVLVALGSLADSHRRISREAAEKTRALASAQASEQDAVDSLKDALAAVDQMLTRVSEERLQDVPLAEPVRRDLLQDALKFYRRFLERRGNDPAVRREAALAHLRVASLHFGLGDYRPSEEAYSKGFAMLDGLQTQSPLDPGVRGELVSYSIGFANVLRNQGRYEDGADALRRAVALAEGLLQDFPDSRPYRDRVVTARNALATALVFPRGLLANARPAELEEAGQVLGRNLDLTRETTCFWDRAQTYQIVVMVLSKQHRPREAEAACRQALQLFERALGDSPSSRWLEVARAHTLKQLAGVVGADGRRLDEAEAYCRRAIPVIDRFAADFPSGPHNRWSQAGAYVQHAELLAKLKRPAEAGQAYRRSVELYDRLAADYPTLPGYRWSSVEQHRVFADFLVGSGRVAEARQAVAQAAGALEALEVPDRAKALARRGHFHGRLGDWDQATTDFTRAIELGSEDVLGAWYPLAVLHLRAGRTKAYRDLCERLLGRLGHTNDHYLVIVCKLAPDAVVDPSRPVRIAESLVARVPRNAEYVGLLGAALYRKGDLEGTVARLEAGIREGPRQDGAQWRKLTLAMAYQRMGRGAEARSLFQEVTRWVETSPPLSWAHRIDLLLLQREAEQVLKQEFGDKGPKPRKNGGGP